MKTHLTIPGKHPVKYSNKSQDNNVKHLSSVRDDYVNMRSAYAGFDFIYEQNYELMQRKSSTRRQGHSVTGTVLAIQ